jgi:hypothetical protein
MVSPSSVILQRLVIERGASTDSGTFGIAKMGALTWHSLELPWRDNAHGISCIPAGIYRATWIDAAELGAPHLGMVYHVLNVPGRTGILLHKANWAGDVAKGLHSDLEGCLSIGESIGQLETPAGVLQDAIERSGPAFVDLLLLTGGEDIEVVIRWQAGVVAPDQSAIA